MFYGSLESDSVASLVVDMAGTLFPRDVDLSTDAGADAIVNAWPALRESGDLFRVDMEEFDAGSPVDREDIADRVWRAIGRIRDLRNEGIGRLVHRAACDIPEIDRAVMLSYAAFGPLRWTVDVPAFPEAGAWYSVRVTCGGRGYEWDVMDGRLYSRHRLEERGAWIDCDGTVREGEWVYV